MKNYTNKTEVEIKQLAMDIVDNKVFISNYVKNPDSLATVFMPIALGSFKDFDEEDIKDIGLIYEYYDKAGPRSINGLPCFYSLAFLDKFDSGKVFDFADKYQKMKNEMLDSKL